MENVREKILEFVKENLEDNLVAGLDHFKRVYKLAQSLDSNFDDEILFAACFLHDIVPKRPHNDLSAEKAKEFLSSIEFPKEKLETVEEAIREHVKEGNPKSKEAIMLHDADLLDFLGATGIVRLPVVTEKAFKKYTLEETLEVFELYKKIVDKLLLEKSKEMARKKIDTMNRFIKELKKEL